MQPVSDATLEIKSSPRASGRERNERLVRAAFIVPAVVYLMLMSIFPFVYSVYLSFYQAKLTRMHRKFFIGWDNYKQLFNDEVFLAAIKNTFVLTSASIILEVILAFACAKVFLSLKEQRAGYFLRSMSILPMMITPLCVALIFSYIMNPTLGILNYILSGVGVEPISWFGNPDLALWSIIFINVWQWTPFVALVLLAGLTMVPGEIEEAARLETKSKWTVLRYVQLPFLLPGLVAVLILRTADTLKLFDMVFTLTRGGPGASTEFISLLIQRVGFRAFDQGLASAQAIILLIVTIVLAQIYIRVFYKEV